MDSERMTYWMISNGFIESEEVLKWKDIENHLDNFNSYDGVTDIFKKSNKREVVENRHLFYAVLRNRYKYKLQTIADYAKYKGLKKCSHTTVMNGVSKTVDTNYYSSKRVAYIYDEYFKKRHDGKTVDIRESELDKLIKKIPKDKIGEIKDLISLRIKSWSWSL